MQFTIRQIFETAQSLEPAPGTEYTRGISELIGRLILNHAGVGSGTAENAKLIEALLCDRLSQPTIFLRDA